jgi:hypothetical protein
MWAEGVDHLKISKDPTENRTQDLPYCGALPQSTAPPLASLFKTLLDLLSTSDQVLGQWLKLQYDRFLHLLFSSNLSFADKLCTYLCSITYLVRSTFQ